MKRHKVSSKLYICVIMLFLYLPIFIIIAYSFNDAKSTIWQGFTFKWYKELFKDSQIMTSVLNTVIVAVISSISATMVGTLAAIGISNTKKRFRNVLINVSNMPIINPEIVTGISLMLLFTFFGGIFGFELGMGTVIIAHICFSVPYVILNVLPKLRQFNMSLYEAALDLGCPPQKAFFKVVLPDIMPGVLSGFLMAFAFSIDDFIITYFTRGSSFQTLPIEIYSMLRKRLSPKINALTTLIFLVVLSLLLIINLKDFKELKGKKK